MGRAGGAVDFRLVCRWASAQVGHRVWPRMAGLLQFRHLPSSLALCGGRGVRSSPGISWRLPRNVGWSCRTSPVRLLWIGSVECGAGYSGPLFPAVSGRVAPCLKGAGQCWGVFWVRLGYGPGSRPAVGEPAVSRREGLGLGRLGVTHDAGSVAEGVEGDYLVVPDPEPLSVAGEVDVLGGEAQEPGVGCERCWAGSRGPWRP